MKQLEIQNSSQISKLNGQESMIQKLQISLNHATQETSQMASVSRELFRLQSDNTDLTQKLVNMQSVQEARRSEITALESHSAGVEREILGLHNQLESAKALFERTREKLQACEKEKELVVEDRNLLRQELVESEEAAEKTKALALEVSLCFMLFVLSWCVLLLLLSCP